MRSKKTKTKISPALLAGILTFAIVLVIYIGTSIYFTKHFYFGTVINGINATGKTVNEVETEVAKQTENYTLELKERDDKTETISSDQIDLKYVSDGKISEIKNKQKAFLWIVSLFSSKNSDLEVNVSYNQDKLSQTIDSLSCLDEKNVTNPQNAKVEYDGSNFVIKDEVMGNKIIKDNLVSAVKDKVEKGVQTLELDSENCYENPVYNKDSQEVKNALDTMNSYASANVTYQIGDSTETVTGTSISKWLYTDDNMNVQINNDLVSSYVTSLAKKYNTYYATRSFNTSVGKTVKVEGGDYGWIIDKSSETSKLIDNIKASETVTREPEYSQKAAQHGANDIGNTYVEVNLTRQHLWVYVNGSVTVETDFVSGNVSTGTITPAGTYMLKYKERDTTLVGANNEYASPVKYWMPFNGGIGFHDANWRDTFGGTIYMYNGSHGCVNLPVDKAAEVFDSVKAGMPVVCYEE